jgi:RES domain-containing protein
MHVYRITLAKFSGALYASGNPARWNSKDMKMIYTASSRALACLENVVHRSSIGLRDAFRTMVIEIPDGLPITIIKKASLKSDWHQFVNYTYTQGLGDEWLKRNDTAVLKIPSAIIPEESNYLLNPAHSDYSKIKLSNTEAFEFDERIKQ